MSRRHAETAILTLVLAGGFDATASAADDAPGCTIICPSRGDFCVGCGRGELSAFLALAPVCEPECTPYEAQKSFWRGFDRSEVARCVMDAARDTAPDDSREQRASDNAGDSGNRRRYLGVDVRVDINKTGAVVVSAVELREGWSSERAHGAWPKLQPVVTTCIKTALEAVRLALKDPVGPSKLNLQVAVSRREMDFPAWAYRSRPTGTGGTAVGAGGTKRSGCGCSLPASGGEADALSWLALAALLGRGAFRRRAR